MPSNYELILRGMKLLDINPEEPKLPNFDQYTALDFDLLRDAANLIGSDPNEAAAALFPCVMEKTALDAMLGILRLIAMRASELEHCFRGDEDKADHFSAEVELAYQNLPACARRWRKHPDWPEATFEGEVYQFVVTTFDIDTALKIIGDREPAMIDIKGIVGALPFNRIDKEHAATVDLTKPLLIADIASTDKEARAKGDPVYMPIDGWHRIYKAHNTGVTELPAVFLTREETDHIMRDPY